MTNKFTRTINTYKATAYTPVWDDEGNGKLVEVGSCVFEDTCSTDTKARAALKSAGIAVKRGMRVEVECIGGKVYAMIVGDFLAFARPIEKADPSLFTRTISTFRATAYGEVWEKGIGKRVALGSCEYVAASTSGTEARAALKVNGIAVKRGQHVEVELVASTLYGMTVDEFMSHAQPVENVEQ